MALPRAQAHDSAETKAQPCSSITGDRRFCPRCSELLAPDAFSPAATRPSDWCRACSTAWGRERRIWVRWAIDHPEEAAAWREAIRVEKAEAAAARKRASDRTYRESRRRRLAADPDYLARHRRQNRNYWLKEKYGITVDEFDAIVDRQGGHCAACPSTTRLAVDHDHSCCPGRYSCGSCIRGVLCHHCNGALGLLNDDPDRARALIDYLDRTAP